MVKNILPVGDVMDKRTIFTIVFSSAMFILFFATFLNSPIPYGDRFHLADPREVEVGPVNFTVSWEFLEDDNRTESSQTTIANHQAVKYEKTFHQNDMLLLSISVYEFNESFELNDFNDGSWQDKSINGINGIYKTTSVNYGAWNKTFPRYHFDYVKDDKLISIECDKLDTIEEIVC